MVHGHERVGTTRSTSMRGEGTPPTTIFVRFVIFCGYLRSGEQNASGDDLDIPTAIRPKITKVE
jgi:hypothetical protein